MTGKLILASGSPRRRELMEMLGAPGLVIRPAQGEEILPVTEVPEEIVMELARQKAHEVQQTAQREDLVLAADTIVWLDGQVLGKPRSEAQAREMLQSLSGRAHHVYTGVCVLAQGRQLLEAECTQVFFRTLDEEEIAAYVRTGEPMDKAGAYGAQGIGSLFVQRIEGDFFNVMGLPVCRVGRMLREVGVELI